jgi:integrase
MRGSLRKRGEVWYGIYREPGIQNPKFVPFPGATKREAETRLNRIVEKINKGEYASDSRLTVREFLETYYLPYAKSRAAAKSFERWKDIVYLRLIPAFGGLRLSAMNPGIIQRAYGEWLTTGRNGKPLAARTVVHYHRLMRHALKHAKRLGLLGRDPSELVEAPKVVRREMTALDETQAMRLIAYARGTRLEVPVILAIHSGIRRGELCGLRWANVDFERNRIAIVRTLEETRDGIQFKQPKSRASIRTISLSRDVMEHLRRHKARQAETRLKRGSEWMDEDLVFPNPEANDGSPWRPEAFGKAFAWLVKGAKVPRVRLHDLRHTSATLLLRAGISLKVVSARLGHSTTAITNDHYAHVIGTMDEEAADKLADALTQAGR